MSLFVSILTSSVAGGIESGFKHVEPEKYRARLLHVKGVKASIVVKEVPLECASLNSGDVFILDAGKMIVRVNGRSSDIAVVLRSVTHIQD
jgi:hypothetical protein